MKGWTKYLPIVFLVAIGLWANRDFMLKPPSFWVQGDWLQYSFVDQFIRQSFRSWQLPLWDPNQFSGMVFLAQPVTKVFSLTLPLILLAPNTSLAIRFDWLLHFLVAGIGMYWLLRQFKVGFIVAIAAAIAYMLSGVFHNFPYNTSTFFLGFAWLPLVFGCFWQSLFAKKSGWAVLAGVLIAVQALSGQGPIVVYESLVLAMVALYYVLSHLTLQPKKTLGDLWQAIKNYAIVFGVGGLLAAAKLLPVLEFLRTTDRESIPLHYLETIKTPFWGYLLDFYPSTNNSFRFFVGFLWPILAGLGVVGLFTKKTWRLSLFLILAIGFFYFASMSSNLNLAVPSLPNLYEILWQKWPGFSSLFYPGRLWGLIIFFGLILASLGVSCLLDWLEKISRRRWLAIGIALILLGATTAEYCNFTRQFKPLGPREKYYDTEDSAIVPPWLPEWQKAPYSFRAFNLVDDDPTSQYFVLKHGYQNAAGTDSAYLGYYLPYLAAGPRHGKFYTGGGEIWQPEFLKRLGEFNVKYIVTKDAEGAKFGLKQVYLWRKELGFERFVWENPSFKERLWTPSQVVLIAGANQNNDYDVKKTLAVLAETEKANTQAAVFWQPLKKSGEKTLVLDKDLLFEPVKIPVDLDNADHNMEKDRPGFALKEESKGLVKQAVNPEAKPAEFKFQVIDFRNNAAKFQINTTISNQPVVYAENNFPGWRAFLDGRETPLFTVNGSLKGIIVTNPGQHTLEFKFISKSFLIGSLISLISLLGLVLLLFKIRRQR